MEQMQAIWSALDEMLEKDPKKYEEFIKGQMEAGRAALAPKDLSPGSESAAGPETASKLLSSIFPLLTKPNPGQIPTKDGAGGGDSCDTKGKAKIPEKEKGGKADPEPNPQSFVKKADGKKEEHFVLKLPVGVAPTQVKSKQGVLIQEISSSELDENEKAVDKEE